MARQCGKNYQFSWLWNGIKEAQQTFPWHSIKLFTTNPVNPTTTTTTGKVQCSNPTQLTVS